MLIDTSSANIKSVNIISLPFVAGTRAASAPAMGRFGRLYGGSAAMQDVYGRIDKVAPISATVLITGESGSGKDLVAHTIHDRSDRARAPFIAVNCGAIPGNLCEPQDALQPAHRVPIRPCRDGHPIILLESADLRQEAGRVVK